jgi:hypothetical protein
LVCARSIDRRWFDAEFDLLLGRKTYEMLLDDPWL